MRNKFCFVSFFSNEPKIGDQKRRTHQDKLKINDPINASQALTPSIRRHDCDEDDFTGVEDGADDGSGVGAKDGAVEGALDGVVLGKTVGDVGSDDGDTLGVVGVEDGVMDGVVGATEGELDGTLDGAMLGEGVGAVGTVDGDKLGVVVGAAEGIPVIGLEVGESRYAPVVLSWEQVLGLGYPFDVQALFVQVVSVLKYGVTAS